MTSYSSNANVQYLLYGALNSDIDLVCSNARDVATSIINATLGYKSDLATVPDVITRCCTSLAAGYVMCALNGGDVKESGHFKAGMLLLESLGEEVDTGDKFNTIPVEGFGRYSDISEDSVYNRND